MHDEILEAVVRDELRDQGLDEDEVAESLATMRDQGMFDVPDGETWSLR
jgi:predicted GNAT family acetyltransferase